MRKAYPQRLHVGGLFVDDRAAVAAFDVFMVADVLVEYFEAGEHFAGVSRVDSVVAGGGEEGRRRWYWEYLRMYAQLSGGSGFPHSSIQLAPARSLLKRRMSMRGTWQTTAPNRWALGEHVENTMTID